MEEIWKDISGYEGYYQVSNQGRVKSLERIIRNGRNKLTGHFLNASYSKKGYLFVNFSKDNKRKGKRVHRLVAQAFIPNPDNLPEVNHKDLDKTNNRIDNLEWCTALQNSQHFRKSGKVKGRDAKLKGEGNGRATLTWDDVRLIRKLREKYHFKTSRLMWLFSLSKSQVKRIICYKQWVESQNNNIAV